MSPRSRLWTLPLSIRRPNGEIGTKQVRRHQSKYSASEMIHIDLRKLASQSLPFGCRQFAKPSITTDKNETAHYRVFDEGADALLEEHPRINLLVKSTNSSYHVVHEAPMYSPDDYSPLLV